MLYHAFSVAFSQLLEHLSKMTSFLLLWLHIYGSKFVLLQY